MTVDFKTRRDFAKKRFTAALTANAAFEAACVALTFGLHKPEVQATLVDALQAFSEASNKIVEG